MIKKKEKINIMGTKYKVEEPVAKTMKALSDALHAHEVALLTWAHKTYHCNLKKADLKIFNKSFYEYCMRIPNSKDVLERMREMDKKYEEDIKNQKEEEKKEIKKSKSKNKKEKVKGAKE
tara:strand:- start:971 stop:1330 length:360 start_codon:yes stop_codon:yes gene_type:complete